MGVFSNGNYGTQTAAKTPSFTTAAGYDQNMQLEEQKRKDAIKQQNLQGGFSLANALREGGTKEGGSVIGDMGSAIATGYKGAAPMTMAGAPATGAVTSAAMPATMAGGAVPATASAAAGGATAGGLAGAASGAGAALASNPVGWAAMAALAAYSLFG